MSLIRVTEFSAEGWEDQSRMEERIRWHCQQLEGGAILFFDEIPFDLPEDDLQFLLSQKQSGSRFHKNISYRPNQDMLRAFEAGEEEDAKRLHNIMRGFSAQVTQFLARFLPPYAPHWTLDFASFRPQEESGRDLPLHKRNDLLHVDAFPTRPTRGARILRVFTNINPVQPRVWEIGEPFDAVAHQFAREAGLIEIAQQSPSPWSTVGRGVGRLKRLVGLRHVERSPYDSFMLRFHNYLKENAEYQKNGNKTRLEFSPRSTWLAFLDGVPHAVLAGQYALEQTYIIPVPALVAQDKAPVRVLENLCGQPLTA